VAGRAQFNRDTSTLRLRYEMMFAYAVDSAFT
jgi:hypothetical protein